MAKTTKSNLFDRAKKGATVKTDKEKDKSIEVANNWRIEIPAKSSWDKQEKEVVET